MASLAKITVFAPEGGSLAELEARLKGDARFTAVRRISSAEGTRRFLQTTREAGLMLESLGADPIPESLELTLRPDLVGEHKALNIGESLRALPGVEDVVVDQARLAGLQANARLIRSALSTLGLLLLLGAGFSTGNVIRMTILAREEEITIMRLVGATEGFIRTPLVFEGAILGALASGLAIVALWALWTPLQRGWGGLSPLLVELARTGFFSIRSLVLVSGLGTLTGALGAFWGFWSTQRAQRRQQLLQEREGA